MVNFKIDVSKLQSHEQMNATVVKTVSDPAKSEDFRVICSRFLRSNIELVLITNITKDTKTHGEFYSFIIKRQRLKLVENKSNQKTVMEFFYPSDEFALNSKSQPHSFEEVFVKKINEIGKDLQEHKAFIYERPLKEGK